MEKPAKEWNKWLKENNLSISANGTVFDITKEGILPFCLTKWYNERVKYKSLSSKYDKEGNKDLSEYWDNIQLVRKIFLNSLYGALLNKYFRFGNPLFGHSTTLSGRVVTKHMIRKSSELIDGTYDFGKSIVYSDTDSVYTTIKNIIDDPKDLDEIVLLADTIGECINDSFPEKMKEMFLVPLDRGAIIKAGREVVAKRGIFKHKIKKKYALYVVDNEGKRSEKIKVMGMETQRSDTPKWMQKFLKNCLEMVLKEGKGEADL
jgi:DNA polymerase elongation subunit (family B)